MNGSRSKTDHHHRSGDGASPGKIFIGGLAKDTNYVTFNKHFGKYGEIVDSVIMKDRFSGQPRGFGFITYADPSVVDKVIEDDHIIDGKQVEIKRTIPKGQGQGKVAKDFKTKKLFVGGIPSTVTDDELKSVFSEYGEVVEHQIIRDRETSRSRGFGFVIFDSEEAVDELLSKGNMIDMDGIQVEVKKAEPKRASNPPPVPSYSRNYSRDRSFSDSPFDRGYNSPFPGYGPGPGPHRTTNPGPGFESRFGGGGGGSGYGYNSISSEFGGPYRGYPGNSLVGRESLEYSSRYYGPYGGPEFGSGYGPGGFGGFARGGPDYGYDSGPGPSYSDGAGAGMYGRGGYSGASSRYHPYAR